MTEPQAPADTSIMGIVHTALRRDLTRTTTALTAPTAPGDAQRVALADHLHWMMRFLHSHHAGEDAGLWPLMRSLDPSAGDLLDQMERDHEQIATEVESLEVATRRYSVDRDAAARTGLVEALAALRTVLDPHLRREEDEMMPIVSRSMTHARWESFNQQYFVKPKSKTQLGHEGHWLIDSIDPAGYKVVVGNVAPIPRFVLLKVFAPGYRRGCALRWGPSVSVTPLAT